MEAKTCKAWEQNAELLQEGEHTKYKTPNDLKIDQADHVDVI